MSDLDEQGRPEPPMDGDEPTTVLGFLDFHRATLEWKCSGLAADVAGTSIHSAHAPSSLTLAGLLKHLAHVETVWLPYRFAGADLGDPWADAPWDADVDWDLTSAAEDTLEDLLTLWRGSVALSRRVTQQALAAGPGALDRPSVRALRDGRHPSLRWILVHLVEEYARHNGHADLIREAVDGSVGE